ncbi:MAG: carbon-nitrogen hydrolase family protein [Isosphaeraceae bacterium]
MNNPSETIQAAAVQMDPKLGEVAHNRHQILGRLREATANGATLVVFPECALTGYGFDSREEALEFAEPIPGPSLRTIAVACAERKAYAVVGLLERDGDRLFNACALIGPNGIVGSYRKVHLPFLGVDRFSDPGDRPFEVLDAGGLKVGLHICYDGSFPETGRILSLLGADVLILPTNWPTHSECSAEHQMSCRAMENTVYAIAVNRVGEERGFRFIGRSSIIDPTGARLAFGSVDREEVLYAEIKPALARQKRLVRVAEKHEVNRIKDRRPGFYGPLVEPNGRA